MGSPSKETKTRSFLVPSSGGRRPRDEENKPFEGEHRKNRPDLNNGFSIANSYGAVDYSPLSSALKRNKPAKSSGMSRAVEKRFSLPNNSRNSNHSPSLLDGLYFHQNISDGDNFLESNYDFEDSHPSSSDADSDDSSLDDVCLPINVDSSSVVRNWPDLLVLEEFYEEETREALAIAEASRQHVPFSDGYSTADEQSSTSAQAVGFQHPLVSKVDTPSAALASRRVNEAEAIPGRLRPPRFSPWDKSVRQDLSRYLPAELQASSGAAAAAAAAATGEPEKKFEQFRYTYFRPSLDSTIHSPSILGLLQDGQSFADLFVVSSYQKTRLPASIIKQKTRVVDAASASAGNSKEGTATPSGGAGGAAEDPVPFWLDVLDPTEEEMKVLSKAFGIHPLTTEDIFLNEAREKVELFKDYYFVCFRSFDIVQERMKRKAMSERLSNLETLGAEELKKSNSRLGMLRKAIESVFSGRRRHSDVEYAGLDAARDLQLRRRKEGAKVYRQSHRYRELEPLNFYIIVFHQGVITFHFSPTPHPVTVRRRARLLKDYLTVSSDWIAYALIDDITDAFGPMIETIEEEVYSFEDAILKLHSGATSSDSEASDSETEAALHYNSDAKTVSSGATASTSSSYLSTSSAEWQRKGDMLRRIGECRKRIMSLLRLLGSKADVIKGLAKRCNENFDVAPRSEIGMYLGDIQDHIITMVQSLNHYEKLLARSHSNYLAQINIDMTKVNNDMNDVLGKITILGTIVLPMNIITGLWGMNVIVPGQDAEGLTWFFSILASMLLIAVGSYFITVKMYNF